MRSELLGTLSTPDRTLSVDVRNGIAFAADANAGLRITDVSNPSSPVLLGSYDTPHVALGVMVAGDTAYVADGFSGLQIIDVSDPTSPIGIGSIDTPETAYDVHVLGSTAYVANGYSGLQIIDISDPRNPVRVADNRQIGTYGFQAIAVSGNYAYLAAWSGIPGMDVIDISDVIG